MKSHAREKRMVETIASLASDRQSGSDSSLPSAELPASGSRGSS